MIFSKFEMFDKCKQKHSVLNEHWTVYITIASSSILLSTVFNVNV